MATRPSPPTDTPSAEGYPKMVAAKEGVSGSDWRRKEEDRLRAEVARLKAEAARLRARRSGTTPAAAAAANGAGGGSGSGSAGAGGPRSFQQVGGGKAGLSDGGTFRYETSPWTPRSTWRYWRFLML